MGDEQRGAKRGLWRGEGMSRAERSDASGVHESGIEAYVTALSERLHGPRALTDDVLTEVRDGLGDAADAYRSAGLTESEAERRAVTEFGEVAVLAPQFQRELALAQGRRTALKLGAMLPLAVFISGLSWKYLHPAIAAGAMHPQPLQYVIAAHAVDIFGYASGAFFLLMWVLLGPGARVLALPRWLPRLVARCAAGLVTASLLAGLVLTTVSWVWAPSAILSLSMLISMVVWTTCLTLAIRSTQRALLASD